MFGGDFRRRCWCAVCCLLIALLISCHWVAVVDSRRPIPKASNHVSNDELKQEIKRVLASNIQMHPTEIHAEITKSRAERLAGAPAKHHHVTLKQVQKLVPRIRHETMRERMEFQIDATGNVVAASDDPTPRQTVNSSSSSSQQQPRVHNKKKQRQNKGASDDESGASTSSHLPSRTQSSTPQSGANSRQQQIPSSSEGPPSNDQRNRSPLRAATELADTQPNRLLQSANGTAASSTSEEASHDGNARGGSNLEKTTRRDSSEPLAHVSHPPLPYDDHRTLQQNSNNEREIEPGVLGPAQQQFDVSDEDALGLDGVDATTRASGGVVSSDQDASGQIETPRGSIEVDELPEEKDVRTSDSEHATEVQSTTAHEETDAEREKAIDDDGSDETDENQSNKEETAGTDEQATDGENTHHEVHTSDVNVNKDTAPITESDDEGTGRENAHDEPTTSDTQNNNTPVLSFGPAPALVDSSDEKPLSPDGAEAEAAAAKSSLEPEEERAMRDESDRQAEEGDPRTPDPTTSTTEQPTEQPRESGEREASLQGENFNDPDSADGRSDLSNEEALEAVMSLDSRHAVDRELDRLKREHDALLQLDDIDAELARLQRLHASSLEDQDRNSALDNRGEEMGGGQEAGGEFDAKKQHEQAIKLEGEGGGGRGGKEVEGGREEVNQVVDLAAELEFDVGGEGQQREPEPEQLQEQGRGEAVDDDDDDLRQRESVPPPPPPPPPTLDQDLTAAHDEDEGSRGAHEGGTEADAVVSTAVGNPAVAARQGQVLDETAALPPPGVGVVREEGNNGDHVDMSIGHAARTPLPSTVEVVVEDELVVASSENNNGAARDTSTQSGSFEVQGEEDAPVAVSIADNVAVDSVRISFQQNKNGFSAQASTSCCLSWFFVVTT